MYKTNIHAKNKVTTELYLCNNLSGNFSEQADDLSRQVVKKMSGMARYASRKYQDLEARALFIGGMTSRAFLMSGWFFSGFPWFGLIKKYQGGSSKSA
ncbi:MAG: hypothetical protein ABI700_22255 [Chloroflexota bacterium]